MLPNFAYVRVGSGKEALKHLASPGAAIHAGGTDLLGCLRDGALSARTVVSISRLDELRGIRERPDGGLGIGALTTITEVAESPLIGERYPGLAQAAGEVASPQLRNQGTLGGNLCQRPRCWYFRGDFDCAKKGGDRCYAVDGENRYHAVFGGGPCYIVHPSDTAPALVALGAAIRVAGAGGDRAVALESFFVLPADELSRENILEPGEMVTEILLPSPAGEMRSSYRKVRERGSWDFALASVALAVRFRGRRVAEARVVLGGVAPMPWRSEAAEAAIVGRRLGAKTAARAASAAVRDAEPLEQNGFKVPLVRGIVEESLLAL
ncbi:MAG: xanthine dehydrogenase family protein subunit M [bacterium]|nr:xanthine dehydrogenase family protein subunit M [bacterium]